MPFMVASSRTNFVEEAKQMTSIAGLTADQANAVEAALLLVTDRSRWDGVVLAIAAALGGSGPWDNPTVTVAIGTALRDCSGQSVPTGILFGV
jgi:hypothetical protein